MKERTQQWRPVRRPLRLGLRGWRLGRRCVISPRGTVFETRLTRAGLFARRRLEFQLAHDL